MCKEKIIVKESEKENKVPMALDILREAMKDDGYKIGWVANIAMAHIDCQRWYKEKTGKKYLNYQDRKQIATNAANYFLKLLLSPTEKG